MKRALHFGGILALAAASLCAADQATAQRIAPPVKGGGGPKGGGVPKGFPKGMPKNAGAGLKINPANQFERLIAMPPEKREQVLEKLPPAHQERLRERLAKWEQLPETAKQFQLGILKRFAALPPEKQDSYLAQVRAVNALEPERKRAIVRELNQLWRMPEAERHAQLA